MTNLLVILVSLSNDNSVIVLQYRYYIVIEDGDHHVLVDVATTHHDHSTIAGGLCWHTATTLHCKGPLTHNILVKVCDYQSKYDLYN